MNKKDVLILLTSIKSHKKDWEMQRFYSILKLLLKKTDSVTEGIIGSIISRGKLNTVACTFENYISRATVYRRIDGFCRLIIHYSKLSGNERTFLRYAKTINSEQLRERKALHHRCF